MDVLQNRFGNFKQRSDNQGFCFYKVHGTFTRGVSSLDNINIVIDKLEDMHRDINEVKKAVELMNNNLNKILNSYKQELRHISENQKTIMRSISKK